MPESFQTFIVTVAFTVQASKLGPWSPQQCALDFVRHRIDEGLPMSDHIIDWQFVNVSSPFTKYEPYGPGGELRSLPRGS